MPSNLQIDIKNNKRELRKSTETQKLKLFNDPNNSMQSQSHLLEYAVKLCNKVLKPLHEVDNYCEIMTSKLKKYLFDKTMVRSLKN